MTASLLLSLLCSIYCVRSQVSSSIKQPHILFIVVDDLGSTDLSYHNGINPTPIMDSIFSTGIELTNYYVHLDCSPTRSAIMTGRYSFALGLQSRNTIIPGTKEHIPIEQPTLPELLSNIGYQTHMVGKWHCGYASWNDTPIGRGFHTHFGMLQGAQDYYYHNESDGFDFFHNKQVYWNATHHYSTDLYHDYTEDLLSNITNNGNNIDNIQPIFLYAAFQTIHAPITLIGEAPPVNFTQCDPQNIAGNGNINRTLYCNKLVYLDNDIQKLINTFKQYNIWDDTILFFSTDNGGMPFYDNNPAFAYEFITSWGCNFPRRGGKATLFEGGVHGIGAINGGDNVISTHLRGTTSNILTHVIDFLPTIIEGVLHESLPRTKKFDGSNFYDAIMNPNNKNLWNRTSLWLDIEKNGTFASLIDGDYKYIQGMQLFTAYFPCNASPYGNDSAYVTEFLFDLKNDKNETTNLVDQYPDLVMKYKDMIADYVQGDNYRKEQSQFIYPESLPSKHNGAWVPWIN